MGQTMNTIDQIVQPGLTQPGMQQSGMKLEKDNELFKKDSKQEAQAFGIGDILGWYGDDKSTDNPYSVKGKGAFGGFWDWLDSWNPFSSDRRDKEKEWDERQQYEQDRQHQEEREDSYYQRMKADMQKAGFNLNNMNLPGGAAAGGEQYKKSDDDSKKTDLQSIMLILKMVMMFI